MRRIRNGRQRGSESIEAVIGTSAFVLFISLIIAGGRLALAGQAVDAAAGEAARSASISRAQGQARVDATNAATFSLANQSLDCRTRSVAVDTSGFAARVGTAASVTATVTCVVDLSDVAIPGLPGSKTITSTQSSPIDTYRER